MEVHCTFEKCINNKNGLCTRSSILIGKFFIGTGVPVCSSSENKKEDVEEGK